MGKASVSINQILDLYDFLTLVDRTCYAEIGEKFGMSQRETIRRYLEYVEKVYNVRVVRETKPWSVYLDRAGLNHSRLTVREQDAVIAVLIDETQNPEVRRGMYTILSAYGNSYTASEFLDRYKRTDEF